MHLITRTKSNVASGEFRNNFKMHWKKILGLVINNIFHFHYFSYEIDTYRKESNTFKTNDCCFFNWFHKSAKRTEILWTLSDFRDT